MNKVFFNICVLMVQLLSACSKNSSREISNSISQKEDSNVAQVVVLLGQSNMEGHTNASYLTKTMPDKANEYVKGYGDVKISFWNSGVYSSNNQFANVKLGQGKSENHFGPEVGIAETMHNASKKNVFIVKYAQGATSLYNHWRSPSSNNGRPGALYSGAIEYILKCIDALENMGYYPEIKAVCWMQGEDDSNSNRYTNYYTYEKAFINDLRDDLLLYKDLDGIYFLDAAIAGIDVWKEHEIINKAKIQNAEEDILSEFIDTNAKGLHTNYEPVGAVDIYHYDSNCMIELGRLFGNVLIDKCID